MQLSKNIFDEGIDIIETVVGKKYTPKQKDYYYKILSDLNDIDYQNGIIALLKEREYSNLPMPAVIRNYSELNKNEKNTVYKAETIRKIRLGIQKSNVGVVFDDPLIHILLNRIYGYNALQILGKKESKELDFYFNSKEFENIFNHTVNNKYLENFPLILGDEESPYICIIGKKENVGKWLDNYAKKKLGLSINELTLTLNSKNEDNKSSLKNNKNNDLFRIKERLKI